MVRRTAEPKLKLKQEKIDKTEKENKRFREKVENCHQPGLGVKKVIVQEIGTGGIQQELSVGKPVLDIMQATINQQNYLAILGETELMMFKWD